MGTIPELPTGILRSKRKVEADPVQDGFRREHGPQAIRVVGQPLCPRRNHATDHRHTQSKDRDSDESFDEGEPFLAASDVA
ncbi:hypothetical protein MKK50_22230 [Methylobacterium sp. J-043]|nr:hypothetical protein [Methylobacterium sp. J-043]